jgi:hypothetical protein
MLRGDLHYYRNREPDAPSDPYKESSGVDETREYPPEGPDAYAALPDDLVPEPVVDAGGAHAPEERAGAAEPARVQTAPSVTSRNA